MTAIERIRERRIGIIGMARSGMAAALLAKRFGGIPFVSELAKADAVREQMRTLREAGIECEAGGHTDFLFTSDYVIVSPGVPMTADIIGQLRERSIPVFSELEFASWVCQGRIVAITGSNGKTTTTTLIGEICRRAGLQVEVCGNIGRPFSEVADNLDRDGVAVVEVSTFQLETIEDFRPAIAAILNLRPDHLDRHGTFAAYKALKYRISENQHSDDYLLINGDDPETIPDDIPTVADLQAFSIGPRNGAVTFVDGGWLWYRAGEQDIKIIAVDDIAIHGKHNLENAAVACAMTALLGIPTTVMADTLRAFAGVEHRLEAIGSVAGVRFFNDSKATNVDSVCVAVRSMSAPTLLILGGRDKGAPYAPIAEAGKDHIKGIVAIGEAREKIFDELGQTFPTQFAESLQEAVMKCFELASPGECVLLSPGCASFDMFDNFEQRGRAFKDAVAGLRNGKKNNETIKH